MTNPNPARLPNFQLDFDRQILVYAPNMPRDVTREQAERKKTRAVTFLERIGEPERAREFADMSADEYAEHKGLRLSNPARTKRRVSMANGTVETKADLQDVIDEAIEILEGAYEPESTREELAGAVGQALDALRGEEDADDGDSDDEGEEDDQD